MAVSVKCHIKCKRAYEFHVSERTANKCIRTIFEYVHM